MSIIGWFLAGYTLGVVCGIMAVSLGRMAR